jgi:hypothetical protein
MTNLPNKQRTGISWLCFLLGIVWAVTVRPVWGILAPMLGASAWSAWNGGCFVLALVGIFGAIKIAAVNPDKERDLYNVWNEVFAGAISFALAFGLVWLGIRALVADVTL